MEWTKELPAKCGYYWWRKNKYKCEIIRIVWQCLDPGDKNFNVWFCRHSSTMLTDKETVAEVESGEWLGPLKVEDEENKVVP